MAAAFLKEGKSPDELRVADMSHINVDPSSIDVVVTFSLHPSAQKLIHSP